MVHREGENYLTSISIVSCHLCLPLAATMLCCYLPSYYLGYCHRFKMIVGIQILGNRMNVHVLLAVMYWLSMQENVIRLSCFLVCANIKNAFSNIHVFLFMQ